MSHPQSDGTAPIVLLHGATASGRVWDPVLPILQARHRVVVPTLAGHLGGPPLAVPPAQVVEGIVEAMSRQLDEAGIARAHLVGNSLGGWVALELARRGRALSVVAISPAGAWRSPWYLTRMLLAFRTGAVLQRSRVIRAMAGRRRVRRVMLRAMAEHADRMTRTQVNAAFEDMAGCAVLADLLSGAREAGSIVALPQLPCPIRIAWGWQDRMLPFLHYGAPMLMAVPGAELVMLDGVGHVPMIDDPNLTAQTISDFVERVSAEFPKAG